MILETKSFHPRKFEFRSFWPALNEYSAFKPLHHSQTGLKAGNPCNITLKILPFSYHKVRSKQSYIVTNHKTNNTKLEHRINVATSVLTSKVRASIFFSASSFQTIRREVVQECLLQKARYKLYWATFFLF